jgi:PAS domain S-box-containing protein
MKASVLLAEDSPVQRLALAELLKGNGYDVRTAEDGEEALQLLGSSRRLPDVLVTDIGMPRMNGISLCRQVKSNASTRHLPVIVLTSLEDERNHRQAVDAGSDEFLTKPVAPNEFLLRLEWVLSVARRGAQDELNRQRELFDAIGDAVLVMDLAGRFIDANVAAGELLGCSHEELLRLDGNTLSLRPDSWAQCQARLQAAGAWRGRDRLRRKSGIAVEVEAHVKAASLTGQPVYVAVLRTVR